MSLLAIFLLWSAALPFILVGVSQNFNLTAAMGEPISLLLIASGLVLAGVLLVPSAVFSLFALLGRKTRSFPQKAVYWIAGFSILFLPLALLAGRWVIQNAKPVWLLLPPLHILAICIPILWLVLLGSRGLPAGSPKRVWGVFGSGLVLGPLLVIILEIFVMVLLLVAFVLYASSQPDLVAELSRLADRISASPQDPAVLQQMIAPFLLRPAIAFGAIVFFSVIVPLIEEAIKPIGAWLLVGENLIPAAGFSAGLLSGAGYALFENLFYTASIPNWATLVIMRSGTALMHIVTAGLTGWALARAWRYRSYLGLGIVYLISVLIHGLWNGLSLLSAAGQIAPDQLAGSFLQELLSAAPISLLVLSAALFVLLIKFNSDLRKSSAGSAQNVL